MLTPAAAGGCWWLPLLLCSVSTLLVAHAFPPPFVGSTFYSADAALTPLRQSPPLDASSEADLDVIAAQRPFKGELIFFQFESSRARWLDFAMNMAAQLHAVGYAHFVALGGFEVDCARMHARWEEMHAAVGTAPPAPLSCVIASLPAHGEPGHMDVHGFWVGRYALLAAMVARRVNVMMLDLDFAIHRDVYADLHEPCLPATLMVQAEGGGPNAGFIYAKGAHPDGAVHWVLSQIKRRADLFYAVRNEMGKLPGTVWEQDILKDAVRVATARGGSVWDFGVNRELDHPYWATHPQSYNGSYPVATVVLLPDNLTCVGPTRFNRTGTGELASRFNAGGRAGGMQALFKPADAPGAAHEELPEEHLLYLPGYVAQFGHIINPGWNNNNPVSALTHLLHAGSIWLPRAEDAAEAMSHVARLANLQAHGLWHAGINERAAASRKLLFIKHSLVVAASRGDNITHVFELVSRALRAAALTNRTLVLPQLPCDAAWLRRSNDTNHHGGIADPRVIVVPQPPYGAADVACYVGAHAYEFCWPWDHEAYSFDPIAARRAPAATQLPWSRDAVEAAPGDVMVTHLPALVIAGDAAHLSAADAATAERVQARDIWEEGVAVGARASSDARCLPPRVHAAALLQLFRQADKLALRIN